MKTLCKVAALGLIATLPVAAGCEVAAGLALGAAAGVGTYAYVDGEMESSEKAPIDKTWDATQEAVKDLQLQVEEQKKDTQTASLRARQADGTRVSIELTNAGPETTQVAIRVGVFGDEAESKQILEKIQSHLNKSFLSLR